FRRWLFRSALNRGDRLHGMSTTDRLRARLGKPEMLDLPFPDEVRHRARDIFDRHVWIDAVLVEEIDAVDLEPLERSVGHLLDVLRSAIEAPLPPVRIEFKAELGRDDDLLAHRGERFAQELFVPIWAVGLGRVEEGDAAGDGRSKQRDHLVLVGGRAVAEAHSHAAEADGRNLQVAVPESPLLHGVAPLREGRSAPFCCSNKYVDVTVGTYFAMLVCLWCRAP